MKNRVVWMAGLLFWVHSALAQTNPAALPVGSKAPTFSGKDQYGRTITLEQLQSKGPVILLFYRGYWCPYCNRQLKQLQDSLVLLKNRNAQIVAISPESANHVSSTIDKTGADFSIISDVDNQIMRKFNVLYDVDAHTIGRLKAIGVDLTTVNASKSAVLPVPAVYIINQNGIITYAFFDTNYRNRPSVKTLLENL